MFLPLLYGDRNIATCIEISNVHHEDNQQDILVLLVEEERGVLITFPSVQSLQILGLQFHSVNFFTLTSTILCQFSTAQYILTSM